MEKDNSTAVVTRLIKELKISVTRQSIEDELQKHVHSGSLLAIYDVLERWNVATACYKTSIEQLALIKTPYIVQFNNKKFAVVTDFNQQQVVYSNHIHHNEVVKMELFKLRWKGTVLVAEKTVASGESNYAKKRRREILNDLRVPSVFAIGIVLLVASILGYTSFPGWLTVSAVLLILFKTVGLVVSTLLLLQGIDANNPLLKRFCGANKEGDCNSILSSEAAKLTDEISWSEIGFFYFAGTLLTLLFNGENIAVLKALCLLNLLALPYTIYSIYYQWRVAKEWCVMCCTIQAVLWLEFFSFVPYWAAPYLPGFGNWATLCLCMVIPVITWIFIKPYLLLASEIHPMKQQLKIFKYNSGTFQRRLNEGPQYALPTEDNSLIIGNRNAQHVITMVANPYCNPCAKAHKVLDKWLEERDDVQLQIVFSTGNDYINDKARVAAHLMGIKKRVSDFTIKEAINDWYGQKQKNYDEWSKKHPIDQQEEMEDVLDKQKEWCRMVEVKETPTLFINGRRVPKMYQPDDLKYFI